MEAYFHRIILRYRSLSPRDQRATMMIAILLIMAFFTSAIAIPAKDRYQAAKRGYEQGVQLNQWLKANSHALKDAASQQFEIKTDVAGRSLLSLISNSAKGASIELSRLEPKDGKVIVGIERSQFSDMMKWLDTLKKDHRITVVQASISRVSANIASARITFSQ